MSKDPQPSTPDDILNTSINQKIDNLWWAPEEAQLNEVRELLDFVQEERVVPDKEVKGFKKSEKTILENQEEYKTETVIMVKRGQCWTPFCLFFVLPMMLYVYVFGVDIEEDSSIFFKTLVDWPINVIAVAIHIYHLRDPEHGLPELWGFKDKSGWYKDEVDDDDGWEDSMTSTELQSRQEALVEKWEQLKKEQKENLVYEFVSLVSCFMTIVYFSLRVYILAPPVDFLISLAIAHFYIIHLFYKSIRIVVTTVSGTRF